MEREDGPRAAGASGRGGHLGVAARAPLTLVATPTRARPAAAATAVADLFFRLANSGSGWSRGWTSGGRGERPRPMGSPRDRRAVAHSGWGSQACSLSVDGVQRQRHAAPSSFSRMAAGAGGDGARGWTSRRRGERPRRPPRGRCSSPVDPCRYAYAREARGGGDRGRRSLFRLANSGPAGAGDGPRAAGASGRDLWGRRAIAGLLRTAAGGLRRALYPLTGCSGSGTRRRVLFREWRPAPAAMEREDGPRAAGASGRGGHLGVAARAPLTLVATPTRARPAAAATAVADLFFVWRIPDPAGAGDGPRAAGASGRDLWGRRAIAGLLRTAAGGLRRALYPLTGCSGSGTRRRVLFREWRPAPAAMEREDGPRAAGASGRGGHLGVAARAPLTLVATPTRARPAAAATAVADLFSFGEFRIRLEPGMDLGRPGRAAATYGVAARSPGCCAQRLGVSGVLSIR